MSPKWSRSEKAALRAAYITFAGAVIAASIGAVVEISLAPQNSSAARSGTRISPSTTAAPSSTPHPSDGRTWTETAFTQSKTFGDFRNAGYPLGAQLAPGEAVQVSCRVRGFVVKDGDPWWYRLASSPWNGRFYATSDVFYNTPNTSGNPINGIIVDKRVPLC